MSEVLFAGSVAGALLSVWGLWTKVIQPYKDVLKRLEELERKQVATWKKLDADHDQLAAQEEMNSLILKAIKTLMTHEIDGNHTAQLRACVDEIDKTLYRKGGSL